MAVFYLKYRPQSLNELVGQEIVKKNLLGAYSQNKLSHAYLLAGPRGTGKTSTARILAKMVNCEKQSSVVSRQSSDNSKSLTADSQAILKADSYPCNKCSTCISITDGSNLDLIEIDAASNRGIEDIRALREKIKLSPSSSKKKVYIIDEVHMLTQEAFNALLKTLEEPPAHALFILATTEVQKMPQTIISRVQRLDFTLASSDELLQALQKIVTAEKINIDEEALKFLVKKAEGSFRDGVKLLDQVSFIEGKITLDSLQKNLKSSNAELILELIKLLGRKDTTTALSLIVKQVETGVDIKELILSLMDSLRQLVFIKNGLGEQLVKPLVASYQDLVKIAGGFTNQDLIKNLGFLQKALEKMKTTSIPSLPLELAVVEICSSSVILSETKDIYSSLESPLDSLLAQSDKIEILDVRSEKIENGIGSSKLEDPISNIQLPDPSSNLQHPTSSDDIEKLKEKWTFVLETIRPYNFSLEALLRSINIKECTDIAVILEVPYSFHQRILEAPKNRDLLESILSDILGRIIRVSTVLGARTEQKEDIANIEVAQDDEIIRAAAEIFSSDSIN